MAIKGKSKSRGAKVVAAGPKPVYVPVKTPLLRRRALWIAVGSVVAVGTIVALAIGFVQQRNDERERDRLARLAGAAGDYTGAVEPVLATLGQVLPPTGFDAFPSLTSAIESLEADDVDDPALEQAATTGTDVAASAENAGNVLDEIDTTDLLSGRNLDRDFVETVLNAHDGFLRAMDLYEHVGRLTAIAAEAAEASRGDLVAEARGFLDVAESLFESAYAAYVEAQIMGEVFEPALGATGVAGLTGLAGLTGAAGPTG